jgi:hypothetical protein
MPARPHATSPSRGPRPTSEMAVPLPHRSNAHASLPAADGTMPAKRSTNPANGEAPAALSAPAADLGLRVPDARGRGACSCSDEAAGRRRWGWG